MRIETQTIVDAAFQAGADSARRECAQIAREKVAQLAEDGISDANWNELELIAAAILERVGKPVKMG